MRAAGSRAAGASLLILLTSLAGCNRSDQEIKVYRVAKPSGPSPATESDPMALTNVPAKSTVERVPSPTTNTPVPPGWEPQPLSQMRQASFLVHGQDGSVADISFVTLGPAAGNLLDNVNRWLGQLAQPPVTTEKLTGMIQELPSARGKIPVVDLTGEPENGDPKKDGRIIAAVASNTNDTAFYKMRGNAALAGAQKDNFLKWVSSARDAEVSPSTADGAPAQSDAAVPQIKWDVPSDWLPAAPSAMRYASFTIEKNNEKAEISVVTFPGDGGNDADNVNRWRQQVGLSAVQASALDSMIVPVAGGNISFSTIDLAGASARTIVGWTRHDARTWFFKLTGPTETVEREKPKFVEFIKSVRF